MAEAAIKTRRDLEVAVTGKALKDDAFRTALVKDPRTTIAKFLSTESPGSQVPERMDIKILEEPQHALYLVIPHVPSGAELSDDELERVAGGIEDDVSYSSSLTWKN